jgi:hypothetical protein
LVRVVLLGLLVALRLVELVPVLRLLEPLRDEPRAVVLRGELLPDPELLRDEPLREELRALLLEVLEVLEVLFFSAILAHAPSGLAAPFNRLSAPSGWRPKRPAFPSSR